MRVYAMSDGRNIRTNEMMLHAVYKKCTCVSVSCIDKCFV